uniref:hypothetical protein n=1 Tax=uncultured Sphingomonas sp. TaxID=158754 RepID=UPI0035C9AADC
MRPNTLRTLRRYHHYLGLFFAPMILLFSVSGAVQTFRLPDAKGAPGWMVWIASVHKDQTLPQAHEEHRHNDDGDAHAKAAPPKEPKPARPSPFPLKVFTGLLSIALALSTITGVVIALTIRSMRRTSVALLVAGTVVPLVLLWV